MKSMIYLVGGVAMAALAGTAAAQQYPDNQGALGNRTGPVFGGPAMPDYFANDQYAGGIGGEAGQPGAGSDVFRDGNDQAARQRFGYPSGAFRSDPEPYAGTE